MPCPCLEAGKCPLERAGGPSPDGLRRVGEVSYCKDGVTVPRAVAIWEAGGPEPAAAPAQAAWVHGQTVQEWDDEHGPRPKQAAQPAPQQPLQELAAYTASLEPHIPHKQQPHPSCGAPCMMGLGADRDCSKCQYRTDCAIALGQQPAHPRKQPRQGGG